MPAAASARRDSSQSEANSWNVGVIGPSAGRESSGAHMPRATSVREAGCLGMSVQQAAVERAPATVVTLSGVAHDDVCAAAGRPPGTSGAGTRRRRTLDRAWRSRRHGRAFSARLALEIAHRFRDGGLVGPDDVSRRIGLRDAEQDAHALRRLEGQVEAGDRPFRQERAQWRAACRITCLEQPQQGLLADLVRQTKRRRAAAEPQSGCFLLAGVVVLASFGERVDVIAAGTRSGGKLADAEHLLAQAADASERWTERPGCLWERQLQSRPGVVLLGGSPTCPVRRSAHRSRAALGSPFGETGVGGAGRRAPAPGP